MIVGGTIIEPLPSKSGLYFQEDGDVLITESSWKLIVYRNLEPLFLSRDSIQRLSNKYLSLISNRPKGFQHTTSSFIKISLNKINARLTELSAYSTKPRAKRELLDGLGSVLKWLIGTPDAKDAQHYESCIKLLEKHELEQADILKQQIQIVSSTVSNFNDTIFKISYDEHVINENLERIGKYLNETNKVLFDLKMSEELSVISIQILEAVMTLESEIDDILTSILFAKSGAVHPSIISVERLYQELLSSTHMRSESLILPVTLQNIHKILDSSSLSSYIYMNKLTYILDFPLVKNDRFTLYHIYSIPIPHPNTVLYSTILPEQPYLATSSTRQQYITMESMTRCKIVAPRRWICNLPVYNYQTRPICEMAIMLHTTKELPSTCETTTFTAQINIFQPIETNKWIFLLQNETASALQCGETTKHLTLKGTGILTLPEGCKLYSAFITLTAVQENTRNISHPIVAVDIEDLCPDIEDMPSSPEIIPIRVNNVPVDGLTSIKEELKEQSKRIKQYQEASLVEKYSTKFSLFTYSIGAAMLVFLAYKLYRCCCPKSLLRRRNYSSGCIQIFNNCFDRRKERTHVTIPLANIQHSSRNVETEDEDSSDGSATTSSTTQKLGAAQSLF